MNYARTKKKNCLREVPILTANNFCKHAYNINNRCCLVGHYYCKLTTLHRANEILFDTDKHRHLIPKQDFNRAIGQVINALHPDFFSDKHNFFLKDPDKNGYVIPIFNDHDEITTKDLAIVWNVAMGLLGYTIGNKDWHRYKNCLTQRPKMVD